MRALVGDLRYGIRSLLRSPGFLLTSVVLVGLGIGAMPVIFSLAHAVLLRAMPYPDSDRLELLSERHPSGFTTRAAAFLEWRAHVTTYPVITGVTQRGASLTGAEQTERISTVSSGFFDVFGVQPLLGRAFDETDYSLDAPPK